MFDRVLVANRGEIACRIMATLRRLGVGTVAVYGAADRDARHVLDADEAVCLGDSPPAASYLRVDAVVEAALATGATAIHPGYGLLSERAELVEACDAAGLVFIGPRAEHLRDFGLKHTARTLATEHGLALIPGTGLLVDAAAAVAAAETVGYPVMLKASAGGGGIGMRVCGSPTELAAQFDVVARAARAAFGHDGVFLERFVPRARHIEVQVFGDGDGRVATLGERDCSAQRRHQKVLEECPAPGLSDRVRELLAGHARALTAGVAYRSAGTVEFLYDADRDEAYFLEVNTRLQVEHPVTEAVYGIDLVELMVRLAAGETLDLFDQPPVPQGVAIEARVYAEDPAAGFRPSSGLVTDVVWPADARVDTWIEAGTEVSPFYDPLLAKVVVWGEDRPQAVAAVASALAASAVGGPTTNLRYLRDAVAHPAFAAGAFTTGFLDQVDHMPRVVEVVEPGTFTTVQDLPGRLGYWDVGVPPSGPMDARSFALVNRLVGNDAGAAGIEATMTGPTLRFPAGATIALGGAEVDASLNGAPTPWWTPLTVPPGGELRLGAPTSAGCRTYIAIAGGIDVAEYLGSRSTFVLGRFGGHGGRTLRAGDVLDLGAPHGPGGVAESPPEFTDSWEVGVLAGPHGAPDFFTAADIAMLHGTEWEVHYHSDRTGVRLVGPKPVWARRDGGEAGLHPSNIHDNAYAVGTVDFTGDMPIILGPDGPSLGGFVCPATVHRNELWKVGQLRAGDRLRFVPVDESGARLAVPAEPVVRRVPPAASEAERPELVIRRDGDANLLVEYGPNVLDLGLRMRVGALMAKLADEAVPGLAEMVPGIRSLQIRFDPGRLTGGRLADLVVAADDDLGVLADAAVASRVVHLPLSWDDPATRLATERYMTTVRADAPWCPWNIEFIRRINGLDSVDDVRRVVFDASYLVLGLGDVYLGAPVATPVDPRHRLVTTKYNPARTWTAENSVGIGGAYLCIYGMEGPGGYQFVGRTVQVWNSWRRTEAFAKPWLLRFFDQIRWYPVEADELLALRADMVTGRFVPRIEETEFDLGAHRRFLAVHEAEIGAFTSSREAAFAAERARWSEAGLDLDRNDTPPPPPPSTAEVPAGMSAVRSPLSGSVQHVAVQPGDTIAVGDLVAVIEAMKTETEIRSTLTGTVDEVWAEPGRPTLAGDALVIIAPA